MTGLWIGFGALVLVMLALDLGVFHREHHAVSPREALAWSVVWVALAGGFNLVVYWLMGPQAGLVFLTAYLIEKALSLDNLFVFLMIFSSFAVPAALQHRVLFWGILGALAMRTAMVFAGSALLDAFHWLIYVFGGLLLVTGVRLLWGGTAHADPSQSWLFRGIRRLVPATAEYDGDRFAVRREGRRLATPLLLALLAVEVTDLVFAVDSIPAVFAVTRDPLLVLTSNVFAILGLRSLYFLLAGALQRLRYLKYGLALVLVFVGGKMLAATVRPVPVMWSLTVVAALLAGSAAFSLWWQRAE